MAAQETTSPSYPPYNDEAIFQEIDSYPWDSDTEFQSGLKAILGPNPTPDQAQQLTLRARCFYFSRKKNLPVNFDAYQAWRSQKPSSSLPKPRSSNTPASAPIYTSDSMTPPSAATRHDPSVGTNSSEPPAPYPASFSQIVELITTGQPIPGIKDIPDTVLEGRDSQATPVKRKKPWEKNDAGGNGQETILTESNAQNIAVD